MDDQPPRCILGLCNVRTFAMFTVVFEFIVSVILLIVALFHTIYITVIAVMRSVESYHYMHLIFFIVTIILLAIDIRLKIELFEYEYTHLVIWFRVCVTVFVFLMFILLVGNLMGLYSYQNNYEENMRKMWQTLLISSIVFGILLVPYYYPVYQYYKYEKTRNQNLIAEQQTMYQDSTELEIITV